MNNRASVSSSSFVFKNASNLARLCINLCSSAKRVKWEAGSGCGGKVTYCYSLRVRRGTWSKRKILKKYHSQLAAIRDVAAPMQGIWVYSQFDTIMSYSHTYFGGQSVDSMYSSIFGTSVKTSPSNRMKGGFVPGAISANSLGLLKCGLHPVKVRVITVPSFINCSNIKHRSLQPEEHKQPLRKWATSETLSVWPSFDEENNFMIRTLGTLLRHLYLVIILNETKTSYSPHCDERRKKNKNIF